MPVHIGTSGWSYPSGVGTWNGVFYPAKRPRGFDELAYYAEHFDTVEVNSTFYRMPEAEMSRAWLRRTPPSFDFSVKLYQQFTHPDLYLTRPGVSNWDVSQGDLDLFRAGIEPIAVTHRLSAVLLQFPASFQAGDDALAYVDWLLAALSGYPLAVELRHRSWSDAAPATRQVLESRHAAWVIIDEPKFATSIRQDMRHLPGGPNGSLGSTASLVYLRLHGRNAAQWWEHERMEDRYDYLYTPTELAPFAEAAQAAASTGRRVLMYLNNHFSAKAVANAAILKHQLGELVPGTYPREMVDRYPELAGVVTTSGLPLL
jgi:uncharacterized protein YecE (DUF72 family)